MKGNKFANKQTLSTYEIQRMEKLRQNAEWMEAKGHGKDSLAKKIFQANDEIHFRNRRHEDFYSDDDEMYNPAEDEEEDEDNNNVLQLAAPKKLPKTMSSFVSKHVNQLRKEAATLARPMTRSGPMDESVKQVAQSQAMEKSEIGDDIVQKKQQQKLELKKNGLQIEKSQQPQKYCKPGSMSPYRDLRRKQLRKLVDGNDIEPVDPCNNDNERVKGTLSGHSPNGTTSYESPHMIVESENRAPESHSQPLDNGSKEAMTYYVVLWSFCLCLEERV